MTPRGPVSAALMGTLLALVCAGLFMAGRHSVDRTPPRLAPPAVAPLHVKPAGPAVALPPRAVVR